MVTAITLFLIGIGLILLNIKAINKEKNSFQGALNNAEINMDEVQIEIGKLRKEFAETLLELQTEIVELEKKLQVHIDDKGKNKVKLDNESIDNYKENDQYYDNITDIVEIDFAKVKNKTHNNIEKAESEADKTREEVVENVVVKSEEGSNNIKINEIERLLEEGCTVDQVADMMKIGKGEILLIKELYLK